MEETVLFSGPLNFIQVVLPLGSYVVYAEIFDEAGAFATFIIKKNMNLLLPDKVEFDAFDIAEQIEIAKFNGDKVRLSQILMADASLKNVACWYNITCQLKSKLGASFDPNDDLTEDEQDAFDDMTRELIQSNVEALEIAKKSEFETIDQLKQGAATLGSIVTTTLPKAHVGAMLDMKGRKHAVEMMEKMAKGFSKVEVPDPNKIVDFIEFSTDAMAGIFEGLNSILYANDPSQLPITDFEAAAYLPYDTDIPGPDAEIPADPVVALKDNAMKITRNEAIQQVKKMVQLVDDIAATTIKNTVIGEEIRTDSKLGAKMIMAKYDTYLKKKFFREIK